MNGEQTVENQEELDVFGEEEFSVYPMTGIRVDTGFYSVFELKRRYDAPGKRIVLDSDFQREDVWNLHRKAELVESVLMGLPLPIFYFNQDKYGRLIVIDGRQRLGALFEYMDGLFSLTNLRILSDFNQFSFFELPAYLQSRLEDYQIQAHVILPPTPDRIKFDIFDRVNRGGMQLNKQEIRNALYQGSATKLLNRLVKSEAFLSATGGAFAAEKRMKDKYLITRFLTFYLLDQGKILDDEGKAYLYKGDIDDLLGRGMDVINHMKKEEIQQLEILTEQTLLKSYYYLGENAFRLMQDGKKRPINMNVFETVMCIMLFLPAVKEEEKTDTQGGKIRIVNSGSEKKNADIKAAVMKLTGSRKFKDNIASRRDSSDRLLWRLEQAKKTGRLLAEDDSKN